MFKFFKSKIKKIFRFSIGKKIKQLFSKKINEETFEELEQLFYESDLGVETSVELTEKVRKLLKKNPETTIDSLLNEIKKELLEFFPEKKEKTYHHPHVILVVGVNGSGKTTSVAKLPDYYKSQGKKVLIAAADTFRAAAMEQLEHWAKKIGVDIIKSQPKSDPSAVVYDALSAAKARKTDIVLIDSAGRLHTKTDLMHELNKMNKVAKKQIDQAPHETYLVLDATTGQNALDQTEIFHQFTPLSGIILTKLDGSAKGGIVIAILKKFKIPVEWVGLGEGKEDLKPFDPHWFVEELLSTKEQI